MFIRTTKPDPAYPLDGLLEYNPSTGTCALMISGIPFASGIGTDKIAGPWLANEQEVFAVAGQVRPLAHFVVLPVLF